MTHHAEVRCEERYGVRIGFAAAGEIGERIAAGDPRALLLRRHVDGYRLFALLVGGDWLPAVVEPVDAVVLTFLPIAALDSHRGTIAAHCRRAGLDRQTTEARR